MKDSIDIGDVNALVLTINNKFLKGKSKIGANYHPDTGITIFQLYEGKDILTIEKDLSRIGAYCFLMGFMKGFTAPHWN